MGIDPTEMEVQNVQMADKKPSVNEPAATGAVDPDIEKLLRCGSWIALVMVILAILAAGGVLAPSALADSVANLRSSVVSARAGTSCGPFRSDPIVEQVAVKVTQSVDDYLNHTATQVPIVDPRPGLKILGYAGSKATLLQGAGRTEADTIKELLLEGYAAIPDCSYTDFGVSMRRNESSGYNLAAAVLAGA